MKDIRASLTTAESGVMTSSLRPGPQVRHDVARFGAPGDLRGTGDMGRLGESWHGSATIRKREFKGEPVRRSSQVLGPQLQFSSVIQTTIYV